MLYVAWQSERNATKLYFAAYFLLVSCFTYPSALEMEAVHSSETPVNFYWTTQH
jgi:starvation-inducible outer membrane lipoprotein